MSVYGNLLFMSVEQTRGRVDCGTEGVKDTVSAERFRGVRIFDISDISKPRQVAAVQTCRGSHTHTIVTDPNDPANLYVYGSGTSGVRPGDELAGCSKEDPDKDPNTALFSIDVIKVPLASPDKAKVVNRPLHFRRYDDSGAIAGLQPGGDRGPGTQPARATNQCHDITAFPEIGLAAGACSGNGILLDIHDPKNPVRLDYASDKNFAYWHSATFNNDGTKVIFTDEWGGGTRPRCRASDLLNWGGDAIFDIVPDQASCVFAGYYKMPAPQTEQENCVAHNGSIVPVPGRDIMVQGWYQGGVSVFDFTDSAHPVEIAFFDRGPIDANALVIGGYWSAYWYNGRIYGSEIARGIDIFTLKPSEYLRRRTSSTRRWHGSSRRSEYAGAGQDQLAGGRHAGGARVSRPARTRSNGHAIHPIERPRVPSCRRSAEVTCTHRQRKNALTVLASTSWTVSPSRSRTDASSAKGRDAMRLHSLAETLKGRSAKLRSAA